MRAPRESSEANRTSNIEIYRLPRMRFAYWFHASRFCMFCSCHMHLQGYEPRPVSYPFQRMALTSAKSREPRKHEMTLINWSRNMHGVCIFLFSVCGFGDSLADHPCGLLCRLRVSKAILVIHQAAPINPLGC